MKLISLRDAEFGSLTENSWCRWVNIVLDAIQSGELREKEPVIKFYGSLLTLTWDDASYERNFDGTARSALEAILRVAEFALHGVRNHASELRLPGWLTEFGLRHQSKDVLCWRPLEYPGVKAIRVMKDYRFHIKFASAATAERFREELRKCGNPEVVAERPMFGVKRGQTAYRLLPKEDKRRANVIYGETFYDENPEVNRINWGGVRSRTRG